MTSTLESLLDEVIALAADAGRLNAEAAAIRGRAGRVSSTVAHRLATEAERKLSAARSAFLRAVR